MIRCVLSSWHHSSTEDCGVMYYNQLCDSADIWLTAWQEAGEGLARRRKVKNWKLRFGVHISMPFLNDHAANNDWWVRQTATWVTALLSTEAWLDSLAIQENDGLLSCMCFYASWWCMYWWILYVGRVSAIISRKCRTNMDGSYLTLMKFGLLFIHWVWTIDVYKDGWLYLLPLHKNKTKISVRAMNTRAAILWWGCHLESAQ